MTPNIRVTAWAPSVLVMLALTTLSIDAHSQGIEEVTVTARKRAESLQNVSVSVQVVSGERLLATGVTDMANLSETMPAFNISKGGASDQLYVRGIGSGFNGGFEQAVGTYIDGIYIGRSRVTRGMMFDLDRVEILKGPQTTFFGNSSIAGAINVTSASPQIGEPLSGHIVGFADFNHGETNFEGAVNIPVGDTFALRVAARKYDMDGYVRNTRFNEDVGGNDETYVRVTALWTPTDTFDATFKYAYGDTFQEAPFVKEVINCNVTGPGNPAGRPGASCAVHASIFDNKLDWKLQGSLDEWTTAKSNQFSLQMNWDVGPMTLTSVTGYVDNKNQDLMDLDSGPFVNFNTNQYDELEQFSQELRATSPEGETIEWMAGVYFQDGDVNFDGNQLPYFVGVPPLQGAITATEAQGRALGVVALRVQDEKTTSAFATATWNFDDRNRLMAGLRWIEVEKTINKKMGWATYSSILMDRDTRVDRAPPFAGFITAGTSTDSGTWNDILPSVTYERDIGDDAMFYAAFSQGFKAGGFDFSDRDGRFNPRFQEETVDAYEVGLKSRLLDGSLLFNVTGFYSDYAGVQQSVLEPNTFTFSVSNAAASSTKGVEFDTTLVASPAFSVSANVTFMDAQFDEFLGACSTVQISGGQCPQGFQDLSGIETTYAPSYSGSLRATYTVDMGSMYLQFSPEVYFTDGYYLQSDLDPFNRQGSYARIDGRITLADQDDRWSLALVGKNLNNRKVMFFANDLPGSAGSYMVGLNRSRTIGLQARYNY